MSDPPRLRDLAGGDDFARSLLRDASPTRPFTAADAARLTAAVSKAGAAGSGTWLTAGAFPKALAAVALVAAGAGAYLAARRDAPPPAPPAAVERAAPAVAAPAPVAAPPAPPPVAAPTPEVAARVAPPAPAAVAPAPVVIAPAPVVAAPRVTAAPTRPTLTAAPSLARAAPSRPSVAPAPTDAAPPTLGDEVLAVTQARAALRSDPARAVAILARAERSVTRPQLLDERDLVHIEALARLGRWAEARDRALALEARAPRSPQSARARALLRGAP